MVANRGPGISLGPPLNLDILEQLVYGLLDEVTQIACRSRLFQRFKTKFVRKPGSFSEGRMLKLVALHVSQRGIFAESSIAYFSDRDVYKDLLSPPRSYLGGGNFGNCGVPLLVASALPILVKLGPWLSLSPNLLYPAVRHNCAGRGNSVSANLGVYHTTLLRELCTIIIGVFTVLPSFKCLREVGEVL